MDKETHRYDDIINMPHHQSAHHPHMSNRDRAAQFSPFAALTGYDEAVRETERLTDSKAELTEDAMEKLNRKLQIIAEGKRLKPKITVTYFQPDERKSGGAYLTYTGTVKKVNDYERTLVMGDGTVIPVEQIYGIESDLFRE